MAHVLLHGADLDGGRVTALRVRMPRLAPRTIDRDTAIRWMRDGHSLIPVAGGREHAALVLVDLGSEPTEPQWFIRTDASREAADVVAGVPSVAECAV